MSDVKRFRQTNEHVHEHPDGEYVTFADFAAERAAREENERVADYWRLRAESAEARTDALAAELAALRGRVRGCQQWISTLTETRPLAGYQPTTYAAEMRHAPCGTWLLATEVFAAIESPALLTPAPSGCQEDDHAT